jgi:uncharacterized membrane protein
LKLRPILGNTSNHIGFIIFVAVNYHYAVLPDLCGIVEAVEGGRIDGALRVVDEHAAQQQGEDKLE